MDSPRLLVFLYMTQKHVRYFLVERTTPRPACDEFLAILSLHCDLKNPVRLGFECLYLVVPLNTKAQGGRLAGTVRYQRRIQVAVFSLRTRRRYIYHIAYALYSTR